MYTSESWLEKVDFGHYRLHFIERDPECISKMIEGGFSATNANSDEYVKDDYDNDKILNYGITMADCYNQLFNNQCFIVSYLHLSSLRKHGPKAGKEVQDNLSEGEMLYMLLSYQNLDEFLYTYAENYSKSIVDEAKLHIEKGIEEFANWLKGGSVSLRKGLLDSLADNCVFNREVFRGDRCSLVYIGCGLVRENNEAYRKWVDKFENDDCWAELLREYWRPNNTPHSDEFYYSCYYHYTSDNASDDLFEILNEKDSHYSIRTKRLIKRVLNDHSREDVEFAKELQRRYNEYKILNDGEDVVFENMPTTDTVQLTPQTERKDDTPIPRKLALETDDDSETQDFRDATIEEKVKELEFAINELLDKIEGKEQEFWSDDDNCNLNDIRAAFRDILTTDAGENINTQRAIIDELSGNKRVSPQSRYYYKRRLWLQPFFIILGHLYKKGVWRGDQLSFVEALFPDRHGKDPVHGVVNKEDFKFLDACRAKISLGNTTLFKDPKDSKKLNEKWKTWFEWIDTFL